MKRILYVASFIVALVGIAHLSSVPSIAQGNLTIQSDGKVEASGLNAMINGLGYETRDIGMGKGKEKYEFKVEATGMTIPIAAELSPSKNYIWLTVKLSLNSDKLDHNELLKRNTSIQPSFFYIVNGNTLMLGHPIDNRLVSPTILRRVIDKIIKDVVDTRSLWDKP